MVDNTTETPKKIPLKWRLYAWWNGYDPADIEEKIRRLNQLKDHKNNKPAPAQEKDMRVVWDKKRVEITQMIWGEGFCGPGGEQNVIDMSKLLALSPKMSAVVIGAGLGGPARVLAHHFGVWISGYSHSPVLAEEGMKISKAKGLEKKAPIIHLDHETAPIFDRQFDRAFSKDFLYTIKNKAPLIKSTFDFLKEDSLFLLSDYVLKDEKSLQHPDIVNWLKQAPEGSSPISAEALTNILEHAGFKIRIHEDITSHYLEMINEAWSTAERAMSALAKDDENMQENLSTIMKETTLWNSITKAIHSGELKIYRYLAHKPAPRMH